MIPGCDVFLHQKEISDPLDRQVGKNVEFMIFLSNKGKPQAQQVRVIGDAFGSSARIHVDNDFYGLEDHDKVCFETANKRVKV